MAGLRMYQDLREEVYLANRELYRSGLVKFTFGNVSGIDRQYGFIVIKPSGIPYALLEPSNMVVLDLSGNVIDGELKPSSDTATHLELYKAFRNIGGIAHSHSTYATAYAQAYGGIQCYGTTHADYCITQIPVTEKLKDEEIENDYEKNIGKKIVNEFREPFDYEDVPMVLVSNHGPFSWGNSAEKAVEHMIMLEEIAKLAYLTESIRPELNDFISPDRLYEKHFFRKHGKSAYYGQKK